jgi:hypothetical protein
VIDDIEVTEQIEVRPPADAKTKSTSVALDWARRFPCPVSSKIRGMTWLDCRTQESALSTVAEAVGVREHRLAAAILAEEPDLSGDSQVDPIASLPEEILGRVGVELAQVDLDGAFLFHGTRLTDPGSVRRDGLQPLGRRLDAIWGMLGGLARPEMDEKGWRDFRVWVETGGGDHDGSLYRLKASDRIHHGPFTVLVRDTLTHAREMGCRDYLDCPEIVQDICRCHNTYFDVDFDLERRFKAATEPCIVTVRLSPVDSGAIGPAIWFIRSCLRGEPLGLNCAGGTERPRGPIPARDVVAVDIHREPAGEARAR